MSKRPRTEKEKMLAGEAYLAADPQLQAELLRAREWMARYNTLPPAQMDDRRAMLGELLGKVGERCWIEPPFFCDYGQHIELGDRVYFNFNCIILDCARVRIGSFTMFGPGVHIYAAHHPIDPVQRRGGPDLASPVTLGENVWVGGGAIICPGVTIGDNSIIGAGSIVTRDVPPNVVAVGNPCRVIRSVNESDRPG